MHFSPPKLSVCFENCFAVAVQFHEWTQEPKSHFRIRQNRGRNCGRLCFCYNGNETSLTALVSYPGSGNTWLRHLLQQATGKSSFSLAVAMHSLESKCNNQQVKDITLLDTLWISRFLFSDIPFLVFRFLHWQFLS